jgi:predicted PurR-regulated permease PerM
MSKTMKLHPVTIIISLIIFGHYFGIIGMLIATPVTAIIKTIWLFLDEKYRITEKISKE